MNNFNIRFDCCSMMWAFFFSLSDVVGGGDGGDGGGAVGLLVGSCSVIDDLSECLERVVSFCFFRSSYVYCFILVFGFMVVYAVAS